MATKIEKDRIEGDPYDNLANAIVVQACKDYKNTTDDYVWASIERFIQSDWFVTLTDLDPDYILAYLRRHRRKPTKKKRRNNYAI